MGLDALRKAFGDPINQCALCAQMQKDLLPYVANMKSLQDVVELGTHLSEYAFFLGVKQDPTRLAIFNELYTCFSKAKQEHPDEFAASFSHYFQAEHGAIKDFADLCHLERSKSRVPSGLAVKIAFQEIGQIIEGCIQPFARHFLCLLKLSQTDIFPRSFVELDRMDLGDIVAALRKNSNLHCLYTPTPWKLAISQWRNIANHCSYFFNEQTQTVTCTYGRSPKNKVVEIEYGDIHELCKLVNDIFGFHKMTYAFFCLGIPEITGPLERTYGVTPDTIAATIIEVLNTSSLIIVSLDWEASPWELIAIDPLNRNEQELSKILNHIGRFISLIKDCRLFCIIEEQATGRIHTAVIEKIY